MKHRSLLLIGFALLALGILAACGPRLIPQGFSLLGTREVNFRTEQDVITVTRASGLLRRLLIVPRINPVEIYNVRIVFENGPDFDAPVREKLFVGRDRLMIDLPGEARRVRRVEFRYRMITRDIRRAVVELWGQ